jgi:branched-subunit amino acid aminotransferase/4-amino-4-deoxychorismate lyase
LPLGDYDIAHLAYEIERYDLKLAGGRQDQYAATFGGVNFMEFFENDKVIVNPLRIRSQYMHELENNLVLYFTATSRESATIIKEQVKNVTSKDEKSIEAMHQLKEQARMMKDALLKGKLSEIGEILDYGFQQKRKMAANISNSSIEEIYEAAKKSCDLLSNLKHNNYLPYVLAALTAKTQKWNDAIVLNTNGRICDTTIANIFIVKDGVVYTPSLQEGCVAGVMRRVVIQQVLKSGIDLIEKEISISELLAADEVFLTNSIYNIRWVQGIGDITFKNSLTYTIFSSLQSTIL